ncbi:TolB family protein [Bacillus manliponensis]|uniref:TolB family protein n=1 Tax=Bacillus manliponensis TaxID=574376 RepID=UPI00351289FD
MHKFVVFFIMVLILFPSASLAATEKEVKAAFIRGGNVWVLKNGKEKQITSSGKVGMTPKWSHDGKWLVYNVENKKEQMEVWAYNVETEKKKKIFYNGFSPSWAPNKNVISFQDAGILNISDMKQFYNIATGVSSYTWLPDGSGFLLSAAGTLKPDGWSGATLFTKRVSSYQNIELFGGVDPFFTLPKEIGVGDKKIIAVYANDFHFSPSNKWISFIVSPTASWSMDSNMLCVISHDGKDFEVLDEIVLEVGKPKWAPGSDTIAFIAGGGRLVFGFKNKDLKIREMSANGSYTPPKYADFDFDWITNKEIVTSRMEEKEWTNDFSKHPLPSLYTVNIETNKQKEITNPPKGYGDYHPQYVESIGKLVWFRGTSIIGQKRTLWKANPDGTGAQEWMKNVDEIVFYENS